MVHKSSLNCCKNSFASWQHSDAAASDQITSLDTSDFCAAMCLHIKVFPSPLFAFLDRVQEEGWRPARCRQTFLA